LDLRWTSITDNGLIEYINSSNSSSLQLLDVSYQHEKVTSAFLTALSFSKYCKHMIVLLCRNCEISDSGITDFIESDNTIDIQELDFGIFEEESRRHKARSNKN
jgi:hypothetical protein